MTKETRACQNHQCEKARTHAVRIEYPSGTVGYAEVCSECVRRYDSRDDATVVELQGAGGVR